MKSTQLIKLGDVTEIARGSSPRPIRHQAYFDGGTIPWIKIADATASSKYIFKTKQYVNDYGASFSRKLPAGSLIVAASGTLGFAIFLGVEGCVHDGWLYFKHIDESRIDKDYLYLVLNTLTRSFNAMAYGAAIQNINTKILRDTEIPLPSISAQKNIAGVVNAYDSLIETNKRHIVLLEKMAEELYCEWFVRMRFPGHQNTKFVKGVPEGWVIKRLGDILELAYGKALKEADRKPGEFHVFGSGGIVGSHSKALVKNSGIIVGRKGSVGTVHFSDRGFFPIDTVFYVVSELPLTFLFYLLRTMNFINNDAAVPGLNRNQAYSNQFFYPGRDLITKFSVLVDPIFNLKQQFQAQNENLTQSRDLLLPRLISGKLSVEDLDIQFPPSMHEQATKPEPVHA